MTPEFRSGIGYDLHRLAEGRKLILGGVEIPAEKGLVGHSDGDILLHAVTDALLGAAALGDIGQHFPPSDRRWRDADSAVFLRHARRLVEESAWRLVNVDAVIVLEKPKLGPFRDAIRESLADKLGVSTDRVSVKAKTAEGLGPIGQGEAAEAHVVVLVSRSQPK